MSRRRRALAALASAAALPLTGLVATTAPAAGAGTVVVDVTDRTGDVKLLHDGGTNPNAAQKRSIDIKRFTVTRRDSTVRFAWTIAALTTSDKFDQVVEVSLQGADPGDVWVFDAMASPQHPDRGTAFFSPSLDADETVRCRARVSVQRRTSTVRVDVPFKCIPGDPGVLRAHSYTGHYQAEGVGESEDKVRVPGRVDLR